MKRFLFLVWFVCILPGVWGSVRLENEQVQTTYTGGDALRGPITLSFIDEPVSSQVRVLERTLPLLSWIRNHTSTVTCNPTTCTSSYQKTNALTSFALQGRASFGFSLGRTETQLTTIRLNISSTAPSSCTRPLTIRIGGVNLTSDAYTTSLQCGSRTYGCFDRSAVSYQLVKVTNQGVCERVRLEEAPAYELGGRIINTSNGVSSGLIMKLYSNESELLHSCTLPTHTSTIQDLSCIVNYTIIAPRDYFICASVANENSNYKIQSEELGAKCGTAEIGSTELPLDHELFARPLAFATPGQLSLPALFKQATQQELVNYYDEYLVETYARNCTGTRCMLPFTVEGETQTLTFSDALVEYTSKGSVVSDTLLYGAEEKQALLTAQNVTLDLSGLDAVLPLRNPPSSFTLRIGSSSVVAKNLVVREGIEVTLQPRDYFVGTETTFLLFAKENITSVHWDFGDGTTGTSAGGIIKHVYTSAGNRTLRVTVQTGNFSTSASYPITSKSSTLSVAQTLIQLERRINTLETDVQALPSSVRESTRTALNLSALRAELTRQNNLLNTTNETSLEKIAKTLASLSIPEHVVVSKVGSQPLSLGLRSLDLAYVSLVHNITLPEDIREEATLNLIDWITSAYEGTIDFTRVDTQSGSTYAPLVTSLRITLTPLVTDLSDTYLIIDYPRDLMQGAERMHALRDETHEGSGLLLKGKETLTLTLFEAQEPQTLGIYILPSSSFFESYRPLSGLKQQFPRGWLAFWSILWILVVLAAYIALQEWYKHHYEHYLFRTKDEVYNLIFFLYNAEKQQLPEAQIRKKLLESGWTGEQITYASRKFKGQRTGMWEIPLFTSREQEQIQQEITKRQALGGRFIKRSGNG